MSQYAETRARTARKMAGDDVAPNRQCTTCGTTTDVKTLTDFGARCFPCYAAYCREPFVQLERSPAALKIRAEIAAMGRKVPA